MLHKEWLDGDETALSDKLRNSLLQYWKKIQQERKFAFAEFIEFMEPVFYTEGFRRPGVADKRDALCNIVVIRPDEIGDIVMTSGFLRELRRIYPKSNITLVVKPGVYNVVELCPYVNRIERYDWPSQQDQSLLGLYPVMLELCANRLWEKKFDFCFFPRWEFDRTFSLLLGYMSGAAERIGYSECANLIRQHDVNNWDAFLTRPIVNPLSMKHDVAKSFYILENLGHAICDQDLENWFDDNDVQCAERKMEKLVNRKFIVVVPGAAHKKRRWKLDDYVALLSKIRENTDIKFVILGSRDEEDLGAYIAANLPKDAVLNLSGETTLRQAAAIISQCCMYIGSDTGLMHVAAAAKRPILSPQCSPLNLVQSIYSVPDRVRPWNTDSVIVRPKQAIGNCRNVLSAHGCIAEDGHCINQITVEEMLQGFYDLVKAAENGS